MLNTGLSPGLSSIYNNLGITAKPQPKTLAGNQVSANVLQPVPLQASLSALPGSNPPSVAETLTIILQPLVAILAKLLGSVLGGSAQDRQETSDKAKPTPESEGDTVQKPDSVTKNPDGSSLVVLKGVNVQLPAGVDPNGQWMKDMGETLDNIRSTPQGKVLYDNFVKTNQKIVYNEKPLGGANANGEIINVDSALFAGGKPYATEILVHEMTHAASGIPDTKNEESLGSTIGRSVRYQKFGSFDFTDETGKTRTFNGTAEDQASTYKAGVMDARKPGGIYSDLPEGTKLFSKLESLGMKFDFSVRDVP